MVDFQNDIHVFPKRNLASIAAGMEIENCIVSLQERQEEIRIIFAAAPSQTGMLAYLTSSCLIQWEKIIAMHMDEYIGLPPGSPQLFAEYLKAHLFSKVPFKKVHTINTHGDLKKELVRYSGLVSEAPIDIVCLGIGENGHIAFNDPPVADFNDPFQAKIVELDEACKIQQVNDGCFDSIDNVPQNAITLTVPTLMRGSNLFCVVLGENKSEAVKNTLTGPVTTSCPASILTTHPKCRYYFDAAALSKVPTIQAGGTF